MARARFPRSSVEAGQMRSSEFNCMYGDKRFGGHGFRVLRETSQEAPLALNRCKRDVSLSYSARRPEAVAPRPWWLSEVCNNREAMRSCIFKVASAGREDLVLFAVKLSSCGMLPAERASAAWCVLWSGPLTLGHIRTHTLASLTFSVTSLCLPKRPRLAHCCGRGAFVGFQGGLRWRVDAIGWFP